MFIQEAGSGSTKLFWSPLGEFLGRRLKLRTVPLEEQTELESER